MINKRFSVIVQALVFYFLAELSRFIRVNYFFGTQCLFFSGINILGPLAGVSTGSFLGLVILLCRRFTTMGLTGVGLFNPLSYHIPTLFASAYWATCHKALRLFVPLLCIAAFIIHPVGRHASVYTLYWLIPILLYYSFPLTSIIAQALGSTFVAHAVGSVLWLYCLPTTPAYWYALLPVVAVERLLYCSGMIIVHGISQRLLAYSASQGKRISLAIPLYK